jgi:hypothetical protein
VLFRSWQKSLSSKNVDIDEIENKFFDITEDRGRDLINTFEKEKDLLLFETESYYGGNNNLSSEVSELLWGLEDEYLKKKFAETMALLHKAEQLRDSVKVLQYLEECQLISQKINNLKKHAP